MPHCKVMTVLGTRPEAIKLAPVVRQLNARPEVFVSRLCTTGQHRQMPDQALEPFGLRPDHDLDIMGPGQSLADSSRAAGLGGK